MFSIVLCIHLFSAVLVANKTDLDQRRIISPKEGKDLAMANGMEYFECSAVSHAWLFLSFSLFNMII